MYINLNPGAVGIRDIEFVSLLKAASAAGFEGISFPAREVTSPLQARELAKRLQDAGMRWGLFDLPCDFLRVDVDAFECGMRELERLLPIVEAAQCTRAYNHVWPGSDERDYAANMDWHVGRLCRLCKTLGQAGVTLGIEFIGPKTLQDTFAFPFIRSAAGARDLIQNVDAGLGIVVDCFHWFTSGASLQDLDAALQGLDVVSVHANDAFAGRTRDEQLDGERAMPMASGIVDAPGVLRLLDRRRCDCPVFAEPFNPSRARFEELPITEVLSEVGGSMKRLFRAAGINGQQSHSGDGPKAAPDA
jgi:sugar phosphate isomerase/epimerase